MARKARCVLLEIMARGATFAMLEPNINENAVGPSVGWQICIGRDPLIVVKVDCLCQI